MALVSLPPELRSICRRLTSTKIEQLPPLLPALLRDVGRCRETLSRPLEPKSSEGSPEAAILVHSLKTQITTLLNGRTSQGRFVGAAMVKAVVENGGWECLRASEPWVRGLISIIQKKDPTITKELSIVTIIKIFTLMHEYPTLVREIVTPNLSGFAKACLQILKPPVSSKVGKAPYSLVETIFEAMSTLVPLYPTTLREFAGKFKTETRPFLVPTISDNALIPTTLQMSSRRLAIRLHMTAAKGGDSIEWTKDVEELVKTLHHTADQVFRAVQETWESTIGHKPQPVNFDTEPQGGGRDSDQLPVWVGVQAGGERIIGLLDFIGEYLHCRTRVAITIPATALADITSRISSIKPPSPGKERHDSGMNPAIGREERDEFWTVFPDIQVAAIRMHLALIQRLEANYVPLAQETLDQTLRIFQSIYRLPQARATIFLLVKEILYLCGPTLPKFTVESLGLLVKCCCRDVLGAAGYLPRPKPQSSSTSQNGQKLKSVSQNADAFLPGRSQDDMISVSLSAQHLRATEALLTTLFSHLPQQHIPSSLRSQMLKSAILSRNRDAQVASILHPARDRSGRTPQVILPYLTQQFPQDESVEVLRFNFRPMATGPSGEFMETDDAMVQDEDEETQAQSKATGFSFEQGFDSPFSSTFAAPPAALTAQFKASSPIPVRSAEAIQTPFLTRPSEARAQPQSEISVVEPSSTVTSSLKRKNEDAAAEISSSKRVEIDAAISGTEPAISGRSGSGTTTTTTNTSDDAPPATTTTPRPVEEVQTGENESSDDESVHLNMELDSDDDEEDDE
ncbi:rRNA processing/ribosome biogenesis-domain-containing protein [Xylaria cf. heliscus]|nr:rRNA processing/ribosome biogenesis-domain-containing protein [Xylaria cf. heliscus]